MLYASIVLLTYIIFSPMHIFVVKIKMCLKDSFILAFQLEVSLFCTHSNLLGRDVCRGFFLIDPCMLDNDLPFIQILMSLHMNQGVSFVDSRRARDMDSLNLKVIARSNRNRVFL